ncbi:hypothetical protein BANRA_05385 [Escherichia coli]|nr:hypothetical protein [Escherichia coli]VCW49639.1 hypothetical protein BANRA_05385 [Escherichia coli]
MAMTILTPSGVAFEGKVPAQYEQENGRSSLSLLETIKKLESYHRDFFLVFAHVEARAGCGPNWTGTPCRAGPERILPPPHAGLPEGTHVQQAAREEQTCRTKTQQHLGDWYPAELEGCDAKCIEDIGQGKACYLKLGELSFEAVKFALSDPASRVAMEPPSIRGRLSAVFTSTVASSTEKRCISRPN